MGPSFSGFLDFLNGNELLIDANFSGFEGLRKLVSCNEMRLMGVIGFGGFLNQFSPNGPKLSDAIDKNYDTGRFFGFVSIQLPEKAGHGEL